MSGGQVSISDLTAPDFDSVSQLLEWYHAKDKEITQQLQGRNKKTVRRKLRNTLTKEMETKRNLLESRLQAPQSTTSHQYGNNIPVSHSESAMFMGQTVAPSVPVQPDYKSSMHIPATGTADSMMMAAPSDPLECPLCVQFFNSPGDLKKHYQLARPLSLHFQLYNCVRLALGETFEQIFPSILPPDHAITNCASRDNASVMGSKRRQEPTFSRLTFQQGGLLKLTSDGIPSYMEGEPYYFCRMCDEAHVSFHHFKLHLLTPEHKMVYERCRTLIRGLHAPYERFDFLFSDVPPGPPIPDEVDDNYTMMVNKNTRLPAVDRKLLYIDNLPLNMGQDHLVALLLDYHPEKLARVQRVEDHWSAVVEMESESYAVLAMVNLDYKRFFRGSNWRIFVRFADRLDLKEEEEKSYDLKPVSEVNVALKTMCEFPYYNMKNAALKAFEATLHEKSVNGKISLRDSIISFMAGEPFVFVRSNFPGIFSGQMSKFLEQQIYINNNLVYVLRDLVSHLDCNYDDLTGFMRNFKKKLMATKQSKRGYRFNTQDLLEIIHMRFVEADLKPATLSKYKLPKVDRNQLYVSGLPMSALEIKRFLESSARGSIQEMILLEKGEYNFKHVMIRVENPSCKQNLARSLNNTTLPGCERPVKVKIFEKWDEMPLPSIESLMLPGKPYVQPAAGGGFSAIYSRPEDMVSIPGLDSVSSYRHEEMVKGISTSKTVPFSILKKNSLVEDVDERLYVKDRYPKTSEPEVYDRYPKREAEQQPKALDRGDMDRYSRSADRADMDQYTKPLDRGDSAHWEQNARSLDRDKDLYGDSRRLQSYDRRGVNEDDRSRDRLYGLERRSRKDSFEPESSKLVPYRSSISPDNRRHRYRETSPFRSKSLLAIDDRRHRRLDTDSARDTYRRSPSPAMGRRSRSPGLGRRSRSPGLGRRSRSPGLGRRSKSPLLMRSASPYGDRNRREIRSHDFLSDDRRHDSLTPPRESDYLASKQRVYPQRDRSPYQDRDEFRRDLYEKRDSIKMSSSYGISLREDRNPVIRSRWDSSPDSPGRDADFLEKRVVDVFPKHSDSRNRDLDISVSLQRRKTYDPASPTLSAGRDQSFSFEERERRVIVGRSNRSPGEDIDGLSDNAEGFDSLYERLQRYEKLYEERSSDKLGSVYPDVYERRNFEGELSTSESYGKRFSERDSRSRLSDRSKDTRDDERKRRTSHNTDRNDKLRSGSRDMKRLSIDKERSRSRERSRRDRSRSRERRNRLSRSYDQRSPRRWYDSNRYSRSPGSISSDSSFSDDLRGSPDRRLLYPLQPMNRFRDFGPSNMRHGQPPVYMPQSDPCNVQQQPPPPANWPGNPPQTSGPNLPLPPGVEALNESLTGGQPTPGPGFPPQMGPPGPMPPGMMPGPPRPMGPPGGPPHPFGPGPGLFPPFGPPMGPPFGPSPPFALPPMGPVPGGPFPMGPLHGPPFVGPPPPGEPPAQQKPSSKKSKRPSQTGSNLTNLTAIKKKK